MRNLGDDEVAHGDVYLMHMDLRKHVPVVKNLGHNDVVHFDYEKHDPIVRNLEDAKQST